NHRPPSPLLEIDQQVLTADDIQPRGQRRRQGLENVVTVKCHPPAEKIPHPIIAVAKVVEKGPGGLVIQAAGQNPGVDPGPGGFDGVADIGAGNGKTTSAGPAGARPIEGHGQGPGLLAAGAAEAPDGHRVTPTSGAQPGTGLAADQVKGGLMTEKTCFTNCDPVNKQLPLAVAGCRRMQQTVQVVATAGSLGGGHPCQQQGAHLGLAPCRKLQPRQMLEHRLPQLELLVGQHRIAVGEPTNHGPGDIRQALFLSLSDSSMLNSSRSTLASSASSSLTVPVVEVAGAAASSSSSS